jgi:hypothetical protein
MAGGAQEIAQLQLSDISRHYGIQIGNEASTIVQNATRQLPASATDAQIRQRVMTSLVDWLNSHGRAADAARIQAPALQLERRVVERQENLLDFQLEQRRVERLLRAEEQPAIPGERSVLFTENLADFGASLRSLRGVNPTQMDKFDRRADAALDAAGYRTDEDKARIYGYLDARLNGGTPAMSSEDARVVGQIEGLYPPRTWETDLRASFYQAGFDERTTQATVTVMSQVRAADPDTFQRNAAGLTRLLGGATDGSAVGDYLEQLSASYSLSTDAQIGIVRAWRLPEIIE